MKQILLLSLFAWHNLSATTLFVTAEKMKTQSERTGGAHYIISESEILNAADNLKDLLQDLPGIHLASTGANGGATSFFSRGSNSNHTLVLIDGVPFIDPSSPSESPDFAVISTQGIEKIEVYLGPQGVLYGSGAIGAVIKITSKKEGPAQGKVQASISDHKNFNLKTKYRNPQKTISSSINYNEGISHFKGGKEKDSKAQASLAYGAVGSLFKNKSLFTANLSFQKMDLDEFGVDDQNKTQNQATAHLTYKVSHMGQDASYDLDLITGFTYFYRYDQDQIDDIDTTLDRTTRRGQHLFLSIPIRFHLTPKHTLLAGIDNSYRENHSDSDLLSKSTNSLTGIYLLHRFEGENFFISTGIREEFHSSERNIFTYKVSPGTYLKKWGTSIKGNYATSFKSPTLFQLYAPGSGNKDLRPEEVTSKEIVISQILFDKVDLQASLYQMDFKNLISSAPTSPYKNFNLSESEIKGYELSANTKKMNGLNYITIAYEKLSAKNKLTRKNLVRRPFEKFNINLHHRVFSTTMLIKNSYIGPREDFGGDYIQHRLGGVFTTDISFKYRDFYLEVTNIFDKDYSIIPTYSEYGRVFTLGINKVF